MITLNYIPELTEVNGVFTVPLKIEQDGKEITGQRNIIAQVKQTTANVLTPEVKLSKNAVIQFDQPEEKVILYITIPDEAEPALMEFDFEQDESEEDTESPPESDSDKPEDLIDEDKQDSTELSETTDNTSNTYPILSNTSNIEFNYIFTSQIKEILDGKIKSEVAKELYNKAINTKNKIVFYRDTNTNLYYWISKEKILFAPSFTELLLNVNEYLTK